MLGGGWFGEGYVGVGKEDLMLSEAGSVGWRLVWSEKATKVVCQAAGT